MTTFNRAFIHRIIFFKSSIQSTFLFNKLEKFHEHLKLSNDEKYLGFAIITHRDKLKIDPYGPDKLKFYKQALASSIEIYGQKLKKNELIEVLKYQENEKYIDELKKFDIPEYPINFAKIKNNLPKDQVLNNNLYEKVVQEKLKKLWIQSNFILSKDQLIEGLKEESFLKECKLEYETKQQKKLKGKTKKPI